MSREIDYRVVEMQFNNEQFERGAKESMSTLEKLRTSLDFSKAGDSLAKLGQAANNVKFTALNAAIGTVTEKFSMMETMALMALNRIVQKATDTGIRLAKSLSVDQITSGWTKYEQKTGSVQTIMNATGKSIDEVNEYLAKLMWFSDETSYGFTDMTSALGQLTTTGGDIEKLIPMITGIANATAYAGKGAAEFSRSIYNLNQSYSGGFLQYMDWKSLQLAGVASKELINAFIETGESLGKIEKGQVTLDNFASTLKDKWADTEVMEKAFGRFSNLSDAAYEAVQAGEFDLASDAIAALSDNYDELSVKAFKAAQQSKSFRDSIDATKDAVSSGWMRTFEIIFGNYVEGIELWTAVTDALWDIFASGSEARNEMLRGWKDLGGRTALLNGIANIYNSIADAVVSVKEAFRDIFPPMTSENLYAITKRFEDFTKKLAPTEKQLEDIKYVAKGIFSLVATGKDIVVGVGKVAINYIKKILEGSEPVIRALRNLAVNLSTVFQAIYNYTSKNDTFFKFFSETTAKAIDAVSEAVKTLWTYLSKLKIDGRLREVFDWFEKLFKIFTADYGSISGLSKFVGEESVLNSIVDSLTNGAEDACKNKNRLSNVVDSVGKSILNLFHVQKNKPLESIVKTISDAEDKFHGTTVLGGLISEVSKSLKDLTTNAGKSGKNFFGTLSTNVKELNTQIQDKTKKKNILDEISESMKDLQNGGVQKGIGKLQNGLIAINETLSPTEKKTNKTPLDIVRESVQSIHRLSGKYLSGNAIKEGLADAGEFINMLNSGSEGNGYDPLMRLHLFTQKLSDQYGGMNEFIDKYQVVMDIINGKYGNGAERDAKLAELGISDEQVQKYGVNVVWGLDGKWKDGYEGVLESFKGVNAALNGGKGSSQNALKLFNKISTKALAKATDINARIARLKPNTFIEELIIAMENLPTVIEKVVTWFGELKSKVIASLPYLNRILGAVVGIVVILVNQVTTYVPKVFGILGKFKDGVIDVFEAITGISFKPGEDGNWLAAFADWIEGFYGDVVIFFDKLPERIESFTTSVKEKFSAFIKTFDYIFGTNLSSVTWEGFLEFLSNVSESIRTFAIELPGNIIDGVADTFNKIINFFFPEDKPSGDSVVDVVEDSVSLSSMEQFIEFLKNTVDSIKSFIEKTKTIAQDIWYLFFPDKRPEDSVWNKIKFDAFGENTKIFDNIHAFFDFVKDIPSNALGLINDFFGLFYPKENPDPSDFGTWDEYMSALSITPLEKFIDDVSSLASKAKGIFSDIWDIIKSFLEVLFPSKDSELEEIVKKGSTSILGVGGAGAGGGGRGVFGGNRILFRGKLSLVNAAFLLAEEVTKPENQTFISQVIDRLKLFYDRIKTFVKSIIDWFAPGVEYLVNAFPTIRDTLFKIAGNVKANVSTVAGWIDAFLGDNIIEFFTHIADAVLWAKDKVVFLYNLIKDNFDVVVSIVTLYGPMVYDLAMAIGKFLLVRKAAKMFNGIGNAANTVKTIVRRLTISGMVWALVGLVTSLALLSMCDPKKILDASQMIGALGIGLIAFRWSLYKLEKKMEEDPLGDKSEDDKRTSITEKISSLAKSMLMIASSLILFEAALWIFDFIKWPTLFSGALKMAFVGAVVALIISAIDFLDRKAVKKAEGKDKSGEESSSRIKNIATTVLALAGSMVLLGVALKTFIWATKKQDPLHVAGAIAAMIAIIFAMTGAIAIISHFEKEKKVADYAVAADIVAMSVALLMVSFALKKLANTFVDTSPEAFWSATGALAALSICMGLAIGLMDGFSKVPSKGGMGKLIVLAIGLRLLAPCIEGMIGLVGLLKISPWQIATVGAVFSALALALGGAVALMTLGAKDVPVKTQLIKILSLGVLMYGIFEIARAITPLVMFPSDRILAAALVIVAIGAVISALTIISSKFGSDDAWGNITNAVSIFIECVSMAVALYMIVDAMQPLVAMMEGDGMDRVIGAAIGMIAVVGALAMISQLGGGNIEGLFNAGYLIGLAGAIILVAIAFEILTDAIDQLCQTFGWGQYKKGAGAVLKDVTSKKNSKLAGIGAKAKAQREKKTGEYTGEAIKKGFTTSLTEDDYIGSSITKAYKNFGVDDTMSELGSAAGTEYFESMMAEMEAAGMDTSGISFESFDFESMLAEAAGDSEFARAILSGDTSGMATALMSQFAGNTDIGGIFGSLLGGLSSVGTEAAQSMYASFEAWVSTNGATYGYRAGDDTIGGWLRRILEGQEEGVGASQILDAFAGYMDSQGITIAGKSGRELIAALKEKFGEDNLNGPATKIITALATVADSGDPLDALEILGSTMTELIGTGMEGGDLRGIFEGFIKDLVGEFDVSSLLGLLGPGGEAIATAFGDIMLDPSKAIETGLKSAADGIVGSIMGFIAPDAEDGADPVQAIVTSIKSAVGLEGKSISDIGADIGIKLAKGIIKGIVESPFQVMYDSVLHGFKIGGDAIDAAFESYRNAALDGYNAETTSNEYFDKLTKEKETLIDIMFGFDSPTQFNVFDESGKQMFSDWIDAWKETGTTMDALYDEYGWDVPIDKQREVIQAFLDSGLLDDYITENEEVAFRMRDQATGLETIWYVHGNEMVRIDSQTNARREQEINKHNQVVFNKQREAWSHIRQIFTTEGNTTTNKLAEIGNNMVQGLVNALNSSPSYQKIRNAASNLWNSFKETFTSKKNADEHSPSKAMYRIGDYAVQGYVNAVNDGGTSVANAATNMWQNMYTGMQDGLDTMKGIANGSLAVDSSIRPVVDMSSINSSAYAINSILSNQRVRLQGDIPNIANEVAGHYDSTLNQNAAEIASMRAELSELRNAITGMQIYLDGDSVVGGIINRVDASMGRQMIYAGRSN